MTISVTFRTGHKQEMRVQKHQKLHGTEKNDEQQALIPNEPITVLNSKQRSHKTSTNTGNQNIDQFIAAKDNVLRFKRFIIQPDEERNAAQKSLQTAIFPLEIHLHVKQKLVLIMTLVK